MYLYIYYRATEIRYFRSTFRSRFFSSIHALKRSVWSQKRTIEEGELTYALTLPRIKIYVYVSTRWLISIQLNTDALADNAMLIGLCIRDRFWIDLLETGLRGDLGAPRPRREIERDSFHVRASDLRAWILSRRAGDSRYVDYQQDFRKCRRIVVRQSRSRRQCANNINTPVRARARVIFVR